LHILIRFFIGRPDKEFFACFEREKSIGRAEEKAHVWDRYAAGQGPRAGRHCGCHVHAITGGTYRDNEAVLVDFAAQGQAGEESQEKTGI